MAKDKGSPASPIYDEQGKPVQAPTTPSASPIYDEGGKQVQAAGWSPEQRQQLTGGIWGGASDPTAGGAHIPPKSWSDIQLSNPLEGGAGAAAARTWDWLSNAFGGAYEGAKGMATGAGKAAKDLATLGATTQFGYPTQGVEASRALTEVGKDVTGAVEGGVKTLTAPIHWSTYHDPRQFGQETMNLAMLLKAPQAAQDLPGDLAIKAKLFSPMDRLHIESARRLMEGQVEAQHLLQKGENAYRTLVGSMADSISQADQSKGAPPLSTKPLMDAINIKVAEQEASTRGPQPKAVRAEQLIANAGDNLSFDRLKKLRTDIGDLYGSNLNSLERSQITAAYKTATDMLAARAELLGKKSEWTKYNDAWKSYMDLRESTLDDLKTTRPDATQFWSKVRGGGNAVVQNMLDQFDKATNPFGVPGQGVGTAIREMSKGIEPVYQVMTKGEGRSMMGRITAIQKHPMYGLVGGLIGSKFGAFMPGGRWIGGMLGATEGAALADKINMVEALVRGPQFPLGKQMVERGAGGMIPDVAQTPPRLQLPDIEWNPGGERRTTPGIGPGGLERRRLTPQSTDAEIAEEAQRQVDEMKGAGYGKGESPLFEETRQDLEKRKAEDVAAAKRTRSKGGAR